MTQRCQDEVGRSAPPRPPGTRSSSRLPAGASQAGDGMRPCQAVDALGVDPRGHPLLARGAQQLVRASAAKVVARARARGRAGRSLRLRKFPAALTVVGAAGRPWLRSSPSTSATLLRRPDEVASFLAFAVGVGGSRSQPPSGGAHLAAQPGDGLAQRPERARGRRPAGVARPRRRSRTQLALVVEHLLEVGDDPLPVDRSSGGSRRPAGRTGRRRLISWQVKTTVARGRRGPRPARAEARPPRPAGRLEAGGRRELRSASEARRAVRVGGLEHQGRGPRGQARSGPGGASRHAGRDCWARARQDLGRAAAPRRRGASRHASVHGIASSCRKDGMPWRGSGG